LHERGLLASSLAPHLVHPVPFLYPLTHRAWERLYVGAGIALYDAMAASKRSIPRLPRHHHLSRREALRSSPALNSDLLEGAIVYYDAQVDDARHTMSLVRTAASHGALVASRTRAIGLERTRGRITGARLLDLETGEELIVRARHVVSAMGVWTDATYKLAGCEQQTHVRVSKGVHFLVPRERLNLSTSLILRTENSVLFVIAWGAHWIVGTTDTDWEGERSEPIATEGDVDYLLEHINAVLNDPLRRSDIEGVYVGLRPLVSGAASTTSKLSREHTVDSPVPGLTVVVGGKYTTYRIMARDALDETAKHLEGTVPASRTHEVGLVGSEDWPETWEARDELAAKSGLDFATIEHLLGRFGSLTSEILALVQGDPSLAERLEPRSEYLRAEVVYAVTNEGALHLEDVLQRRTHLSIETYDRALSVADATTRLMAPLLGWDQDRIDSELKDYRQLAEKQSEWM
jgi:glycerol-3-phosphate dehydrogenase